MRKLLNILFLALTLISVSLYGANAEPASAKSSKPNITKAEMNAVEKVEENTATDEFDLKQISTKISAIEKDIADEELENQSFDEVFDYLSNAIIWLEDEIRKLEKEAAYAQEALSAFGETPTEGEEEDSSIAEMREKYNAAFTLSKNKLTEAKLVLTETKHMKTLVDETHKRISIGKLIGEKNMIIAPRTFFLATRDAAVFFWQLTISPVQWFKNLNDEGRAEFFNRIWYVLLVFGVACTFGLWLRRYIMRRWGYARTVEQPRYGQKVGVAFITALAYGVIPSLLIGGCLVWEIANPELINSQFGVMLWNLLFSALWVTLSMAATRVVLAPWHGKWRLFNVTDMRANRVFTSISGTLILLGIMAFFIHVATSKDSFELSDAYFETSDALKLFLNVCDDIVKAFSIIWITASIFGEIKEDKIKDEELNEEQIEGVSRGAKVILLITLFSLATLGVSLFGYPDLATEIFNKFLISVLLLGSFAVIRMVIYDILRRSIVFCFSALKIRKRLLSKADFLMSLLVTPVLVMLLLYLLLLLWGVPSSSMAYAVKKLVFGFKVGGIEISLIAIMTGILIFIVSLYVFRMFNRRLANNLLNRINMDEGIKHSLISGVSFIGIIISAILAIVAMGVDLSNLAVIAGALSVGIGFGLQDIIKNLVSGIILLFERPFKVGDWVIIGGEEGLIKQINIRSTELETWTKRSVIIPNATLISSSVVNLTHGDNWQRQSILVGVSYDSDVKKVSELLLECARANRKVAKVPAPVVLFKDFGASSLDFELRFHVANVRTDWGVNSDLRYAILERFRAEGIEIAYPQIVVHQAEDNPPVEA